MELLDKIKQIQILTPKPGDVLVVTVDKSTSNATMNQIAKTYDNSLMKLGFTEKNIQVIYYAGDMKIDIVRKEE
jgi:hypothetical protein